MAEYGILGWWTIIHILTGVLIGFIANSWKFKKVKAKYAYIIAFCLLVLWEIFEKYVAVPLTGFGIESIVNRVSDIVIGYVAFLIAYYYARKK